MNQFLQDLYGEQEGFVYAPTKEGGWKQHFFEWPKERAALESHLTKYNEYDVYISPVLFSEKRIAPETFKGTQYLWTEFDGQTPGEFISPSMRIMSSQEGHEHWYWKLDEFTTDRKKIEDITRRIAYHYSADLSVWDYQNVLRPPDTWNHKRNRPVTLVERDERLYSINDFLDLPIPAASTKISIQMGELPPRMQVLAKYKWKANTLDLLFKDEITDGKRSDALVRLAYDAIEAGCSNEETYVLLEERDSVWGKFVGRTDREKRLLSQISYVRSKKLASAEIDIDSATEVYRFHDFMSTDIKLEWAVEGLLPVAGSLVVLGAEGIGKSTFLLRMGMDISLGRERFLNWAIKKRQRVLFVSLEMQHAELKSFYEDMQIPLEQQIEMQEWMHIWPIGHAYPFDTPDQQVEILKYIDRHKIDIIIIDSLGLSMYGSTKNDDDVKRLNAFMNEDIRKARKCSYIFIHHTRKKGTDEPKKMAELDDSFGSRYITANAQTVALITQKPSTPKLNIRMLKTRMSLQQKDFEITRTPDRGFKVADDSTTTTNRVQSDDGTKDGHSDSDQGKSGIALGKVLRF